MLFCFLFLLDSFLFGVCVVVNIVVDKEMHAKHEFGSKAIYFWVGEKWNDQEDVNGT